MSTASLYVFILLFGLTKSHCGIKLPGYSSHFHDVHHEEFLYNYGSDFGVWDRVFGTMKLATTTPAVPRAQKATKTT